MFKIAKDTPPSHDEQFLKFLQKSFGSTFVPFFGALISTVALLFIALIFLMYSTVTFMSNDYDNNEFGNNQNIQLKKPMVI